MGFSEYLVTGKTQNELLDEEVSKIIDETKTSKEAKKEALKKLGLKDTQITKLLNEETEKARLKKVMKLLGINNKEVETLLETKMPKEAKREALKKLGLKDSQIKQLLNERNGEGLVYICPDCKRPTAIANGLGWRTCTNRNCRWEERHPMDLEEVKDVDESVCLKECVVDIEGYKYDVEIMDGTHIRMKEQGRGDWGIPLHFNQVRPETIEQLKKQGMVNGNFFKTHKELETFHSDILGKNVTIPENNLQNESIQKITKVCTTHHKDNNQTITYINWIDSNGKTGTTSGDPNSTHIKELVNRAKREKAEIINEEKEEKPKIVKYDVWHLDTWGNEQDGWTENDRSKVGSIELDNSLEGESFNEQVLNIMKSDGYLNNAVTLKDIEIESDDENTIYINDAKNGKFLYTITKE